MVARESQGKEKKIYSFSLSAIKLTLGLLVSSVCNYDVICL